MLVLLLAACETARATFQAGDNPLDEEFVVDLERIISRTRLELEAFAKKSNQNERLSLR
jgi:hypothetical protein